MDLFLLTKAFILGIVEGLTEFLPISSTGHIILASALLDFNDERGKVFAIAIQLAAILAICWEYRAKILRVISGIGPDPDARRFVLNLIVAFLPAAVLGLLFIKIIKQYLFHPVPVALAFIIGGIVILWAERRQQTAHIAEMEDIDWKLALKVGLVQCVALIPGTSRSGATIIGGLFLGLSRKAAIEFSFFLAIPIMFAATFYDVYKHRDILSVSDIDVFAVGFAASFISALIAVRGLLRFISNHDFTVFAWYRIAFGIIVLLTAYTGIVDWSST